MAADRFTALRTQARAHHDRLTEGAWLTVTELAARWRISRQSVRDIPRAELPYREFGSGLKLRRRRYHPEAVAQFEATDGAVPVGRGRAA